MIELLLEAGEWHKADDIFVRASRGDVWQALPAAQLGQRCASAFVVPSERREMCRIHLSAERLSYYLNAAGLCALHCGDAAAAVHFLEDAVAECRNRGDSYNLSVVLRNLTETLIALGYGERAGVAARESASIAATKVNQRHRYRTLVFAATSYEMVGESIRAEELFLEADRDHYSTQRKHLHSGGGTLWGEFLLHTDRAAVARILNETNAEICDRRGWSDDLARVLRLLARCDLFEGDVDAAGLRLERAIATFREGDMVVDVATILPDLGEYRRRTMELDLAERHCHEAVSLAAPRELVPAHSRALAIRAMVRADQYRSTGVPRFIARARDDAEDALRLSSLTRYLPWMELLAYEANCYIDAVENVKNSWKSRADGLRGKLVPLNLDPNPLGTINSEFKGKYRRWS
jgi:tetratricopeptide (TPR) repeat protein